MELMKTKYILAWEIQIHQKTEVLIIAILKNCGVFILKEKKNDKERDLCRDYIPKPIMKTQ